MPNLLMQDPEVLFSNLYRKFLILGVFWFLIIRPQQKKQKEHQRMVDSLRKGDKIVTNGGIFGTIVNLGRQANLGDCQQVSNSVRATPGFANG
ncbi:MAG: hypothetical protein CM1200mP30_08810 [Pseudomonadota bacterium]|nr:MAG: hypothetical protein CM1200mP30_08810 [Pseudomonadota bacterium]